MRLGELTFVPIPRPLAAGERIEVRMDYLPADVEVFPALAVVGEDELLSSRAQAILKHADAVVVVAGFDKSTEHEGADRTFALPPMQNEMIQQIARRNPNLVLALTGGGNVDMRPWIDQVPAVLHLWYPGQEGGRALAKILFGEQNPDGKLPVSFETRWEDNPTHDSYYPQTGKEKTGKDTETPHIRYAEGVFLGYRYYESPAVNQAGVRPHFPFGFGLSYTTFAYSALQLGSETVPRNGRLTVTFRVTNTGSVAGADVAQVYVGEPEGKAPRPAIELKGFQKVSLQPGETKTVTLTLDDRAFAYWSPERKDWTVDRGKFVIAVGDSSESLPLRGVVAHD
jgi:beta-glucosidase